MEREKAVPLALSLLAEEEDNIPLALSVLHAMRDKRFCDLISMVVETDPKYWSRITEFAESTLD
ncbi:MAG: hypothetical protein AAF936_13165 [Pseudomonadota bacterium]